LAVGACMADMQEADQLEPAIKRVRLSANGARPPATPMAASVCPSASSPLEILLLSGCGAPLDFGGRLAELLWANGESLSSAGKAFPRSRPGSDFTPLLGASRAVQMGSIVGIKERRAFVFASGSRRESAVPQPWCTTEMYHSMCELIRIALPEQWQASRKLRMHTSEDADYHFAMGLCNAHIEATQA